MYSIEEYGMRLRHRREELKLSRDALALEMTMRGAGVHRETIKSWENGDPCSIRFVPVLCEILDCDTEYLFGNSQSCHKEIADASATTGLSNKAISLLAMYYSGCDEPQMYSGLVLSRLVEGEYFVPFIDSFIQAINYTYSKPSDNDEESKEPLADRFGPLDDLAAMLNSDIVGINLSQKYELLMSALKHRFMDICGKFFEEGTKGGRSDGQH